MNLYKKAIEEISQEISWDNWKDEETGKYWEVPEVLYCKLSWVIERLSEDDQFNDEENNNSEYIDTLLQCSKLLETLDDNGIKKIK